MSFNPIRENKILTKISEFINTQVSWAGLLLFVHTLPVILPTPGTLAPAYPAT